MQFFASRHAVFDDDVHENRALVRDVTAFDQLQANVNAVMRLLEQFDDLDSQVGRNISN